MISGLLTTSNAEDTVHILQDELGFTLGLELS